MLINEGLAVAQARLGGLRQGSSRPIRRHGSGELSQADKWERGESIWDSTQGSPHTVDEMDIDRETHRGRRGQGAGQYLRCGCRGGVTRWTGGRCSSSNLRLPAGLVEGTRSREGHGPGRRLRAPRQLGYPPAHFTEEVRAACPIPTDRTIDLPAGTPVIVIARIAHTAAGVAVEVNEMVLGPASYVLQYDFDHRSRPSVNRRLTVPRGDH